MLALLSRIVKHEGVNFSTVICIIVENAIFKKKFGLWGQGHKVRYLGITDRGSSCFVEELDASFKMLRRVEVQLTETPLPTAICESK